MADREIIPYEIRVPDADLADLRQRLRRTRWPEPATADGWAQGPPLDEVRDLCRYWADGYDWRATEARLNARPQFRTRIDGLGIHYVHAPRRSLRRLRAARPLRVGGARLHRLLRSGYVERVIAPGRSSEEESSP